MSPDRPAACVGCGTPIAKCCESPGLCCDVCDHGKRPDTAACPTCGAREGEPCVPPNPYPEGSGEHLLYEIFGKREACDD